LLQTDTCDAILNELVTVLRDDFHWDGYRIHFMREEIKRICRHVRPTRKIGAVPTGPDDNAIPECAVGAGSGFIVTSEKDLLRLKQFEGIEILRASEFLNIGPR
jgi:predicted nucleic acid-binding protein